MFRLEFDVPSDGKVTVADPATQGMLFRNVI
jgi:hypothetical protein